MQYKLKQATSDDYEFIYNLNKLTMKKFVEELWGWDEEFQKKRFKEHFILDGLFVIIYNDNSVRRVGYKVLPDKVVLEEIQILPEYQGKGLGTAIINSLIKEAKKSNKYLQLQVLKINKNAKKLYDHLGFSKYEETETHYLMKKL